MTRLLATVVLAAAVGGVALILFRAGTSPSAPVAAVSAAPRLTGSVPPRASPTVAKPAAHAKPRTTTTAATAGPAPFVQTFAAQPGVRPQPALPSPTSTHSVPAGVDGCDHAYGTRSQCIPRASPAA